MWENVLYFYFLLQPTSLADCKDDGFSKYCSVRLLYLNIYGYVYKCDVCASPKIVKLCSHTALKFGQQLVND